MGPGRVDGEETVKHFISGKEVACDTETTGLDLWHGDSPFAFSFCNAEGDQAYLEWSVDPFTREVQADKKELKALKDFFEDESITKVFHHAKFDVRALELGHGIVVCGPGGPVREGGRIEETLFAAHACNSRERSFGLKPLAHRYLGIGEEDQDDLKQCVRKLRRWAAKDGWKIAYKEKEKADGTTGMEPQVEADYWIPRTAYLLGKKWAPKSVAGLCEKYAVLDTERTMLLWLMYKDRMEELEVRDTYEREIALFDQVYRMEARGVTVRAKAIDESIAHAKKVMRETLHEIEKKYGWKGINMRSHPQVSKMLFDKNRVPVSPKYGRSTKMEAIFPHSENPAVAATMRYRTYEKGLGSFYLKYRKIGIDERGDGYLTLHSNFRQTGADTSRFASSDPNLQQVSSPESSKNAAALPVREVFGPREDQVWVSSDYDGQEIRLYAEVSDEPNMIKALEQGRDIHSMIISRICGGEGNRITLRGAVQALGLDNVQVELNAQTVAARKELGVRDGKVYSVEDQNRIASTWMKKFDWDIEKAEKSIGRKNTRGRLKMTTFGRIYGASAKTLADTLREPLDVARDIIEIYNSEFPHISDFMREMIRKVKKDGHVRTLWNRRLAIDPDRAYTVVNYLIQGTASDLLKQAMENIDHWFRKIGLDASVIMPIHDELITEVPAAECTLSFLKKYAACMEDTKGHLRFRIPTKPLLITESWQRPRMIKKYPYV